MQRLCRVLSRIGANPVEVSLPNLPGHLKTGADDFIVHHGRQARKKLLALPRRARGTSGRPKLTAPPITNEELKSSRPSPTCIVERMFYADVGTVIAPGGVGKTTLMLYISMRVVLGLPIFGERVLRPGPVLFITAEDNRELLVARLRACMDFDNLTAAQRQQVMDGVRIVDVTGEFFKLTAIVNDTIKPSPEVDELLELARDLRPVLMFIDPAVSFGVGEARVNDAEQALIEVGRNIRNEVGCGVIYVHHSGKANAREKARDQYAGRGGSAFADGSRMVIVMQNLTADEWLKETGNPLADGEAGIVLVRPKMTFCSPPGNIHIKRIDFRFERIFALPTSKAVRAETSADLIWSRFDEELRQGHYHTKNSMWTKLNMEDGNALGRDAVKGLIDLLVAHGRLVERELPNVGKYGARKYLHPVMNGDARLTESGGTVQATVAKTGKTSGSTRLEKHGVTVDAALREQKAVSQAGHSIPPVLPSDGVKPVNRQSSRQPAPQQVSAPRAKKRKF
jgi:hypothetical protein